MATQKIIAQDIKAGMRLVNIGRVDSVQITPQHVRIVSRESSILLSAAFFWYHKNETLFIHVTE